MSSEPSSEKSPLAAHHCGDQPTRYSIDIRDGDGPPQPRTSGATYMAHIEVDAVPGKTCKDDFSFPKWGSDSLPDNSRIVRCDSTIPGARKDIYPPEVRISWRIVKPVDQV